MDGLALYTVKTVGDKPVPFGNLGRKDGTIWNYRVIYPIGNVVGAPYQMIEVN